MSGLLSFFSGLLLTNNDSTEYRDSLENTVAHQQQVKEEPREAQSYSDWRKERNKVLATYFNGRLVYPKEEEKEEQDEEEAVVPENDEVNVPFWNDPESQQQQQASESSQESLPPTTKPQKKLPHIDETENVVDSLADLDFNTRQFSLSLGQVEKVWPLRTYNRHGRAPMKEDDSMGPLVSLYKHHLALEVTQLQTETVVTRAANAAFQTTKANKRIRIYFYNRYARHISELIGRENASKVLISLQKVPAKCIMRIDYPFEEQVSFHDAQGLSPYCLCIGDKSSLKLEDEDGNLSKTSFDAMDLRVTLTRCPHGNGDPVEMELTCGTVQMKEIEDANSIVLLNAYQAWQEAQQQQQVADDEAPLQDDDASLVQEPQIDNNTRRQAGQQDGPDPKRQRTEVKYHTLNELQDVFKSSRAAEKTSKPSVAVNLNVAVLGFSSPTLTKGFDWMVNLTVVDESLPLPQTENDTVVATTAVIFCRERERLPQVLTAGDVLRCHRVGVQEYNGEVQIVGRKGSSYVVVRPKEGASTEQDGPDNWNAVPTAKHVTCFEAQDYERAATLWRWARKRFASHPTMKAASKKKLWDIAVNDQDDGVTEHGDFTVMVSSILAVPPEHRTNMMPLGFLRVWDGTGAPTSDRMPVATAVAAAAVRNGDPPNEALVSIASAVDSIKSLDDADNELEPPKSLCGRVANVAVWEQTQWDLVRHTVQVGSFVRLRNVNETKMPNGLRCLMLQAKSSLTPLPDYTFEVKELLQRHQERVLRKEPYNPQSGVLPLDGEAATVAGAASVPGTANAEGETVAIQNDGPTNGNDSTPCIALCISKPAPSTFTIKFRIIRTIPSVHVGAQGFRNLCKADQSGKQQFRFALQISDASGEIDVIVSNDVAQKLFEMRASEACRIPTPDAVSYIEDIASVSKRWKGEIRSVDLNGSRFFILRSISSGESV